jgi:1-deoxy-D-xylulose-5-phosphate synthase
MSDPLYPILSSIVSPQDVRKLGMKELKELAGDVRQAILDKVSQTGGHFSSNLGTVELTVALYAAYDAPPAKVIWDTGHQAYPHKLLTGRLPRFDTLRQHKGLSGFLKREEHELDHFGAGHAGTAISAALGFALARERMGGKEPVVAVTGDAAICSGMSWEALNHAGELKIPFTVILNDNRMSIGPSVGALHNHLARVRASEGIQKLARAAKEVVERIPGPMPRIAAGLRHGVTHLFAPEETGTIFEEMGFEYIGPVDGHDLETLVDIFQNIQAIPTPVFVHALTVKGKGYSVAEEDATKWHGVVPFDVNQCELPGKSGGGVPCTKVFGDALTEAARQDPKIMAITAGMPDGTGLTGFARELPAQYVDVGIAEEHAVTLAAGMAAGGLKPFVAVYSTFLQRGFDQIAHDVCLQKLPVRFIMDRAGLVGADGPTHHGTMDISFLSILPGMTLCAPRDGTELREMVAWMAGWDKGPSAMRFPRGVSPDSLPESRTPLEWGKAELLGPAPASPQAVVCAYGSMVAPAWEAARVLESEGCSVAVVNARWAKPLDEDMILGWAANAGCIVTVEENVERGGFGEAVRSGLHRRGLGDLPHLICALPDAWVEHGSQDVLLAQCGLDAAGIAAQIREAVRLKGKKPSRPRTL